MNLRKRVLTSSVMLWPNLHNSRWDFWHWSALQCSCRFVRRSGGRSSGRGGKYGSLWSHRLGAGIGPVGLGSRKEKGGSLFSSKGPAINIIKVSLDIAGGVKIKEKCTIYWMIWIFTFSWVNYSWVILLSKIYKAAL